MLVEAAKTAPITWAQRLGYILELIKAESTAEQLKAYVREHAREYRELMPSHSTDGLRASDWKLIINAELEPDL